MTLINTLKAQVDLPVWEQTRFAPVVSSAISSACSPDNSLFDARFGRYIYYLINATNFWRYDTWTDSYTQLASPPIAPVTWSSMKFSGGYGFEGRVLGATSTTIQVPAFTGNVLQGYDVRIISGTGNGQQRTITSVADPVIGDFGVATAVTVGQLTDSTKAWTVNQWQGYQMRVTYGTGVGQVRRIITNDATTLYFQGAGQQAVDYQSLVADATLSATAGSQSHYAIESSIVTLDTAWDVTPNETSKFRVLGGAVILASSAAATPFYTLQVYDCLSDTWYRRTATSALLSAVGTDGCIERTTENASIWSKGKATDGTTTTLVDSSKNWSTDEHKDRYVRIYSGVGRNQIAKVLSNTATTLTFTSAVSTAPDATSRYLIDGFDGGTASSGSTTTLVDSTKAWTTNQWKNFTVRIVAGTGAGKALPILSNTATTLTLYKPTVALDATSQYVIQGDKDNIYMFLGGQASTFIHSLEADMATAGRSVDDGCARIGSAQYGDFPPVPVTNITGAGTTKTVTTAVFHNFKTGMSVTHRGDIGASAVQNNITATVTVTGLTTYTYTAPGSTAAATFAAHSTTTLIDASKTWATNVHANKVCYFLTAAPVIGTGAATMVAMEIASNTANTLTFKTATTAPLNGISRYIIAERPAIGANDSGIATGTQSTTTLQDTSKTWVVNAWAGCRLKMVSGAGQSIEVPITSNTSNTLTFGATTAPIANSTSYSIIRGTVRGLGINPMWNFGVSNGKGGKCIYIPRGGAVAGFDELDLTTDVWRQLTTSPISETLTTGSMYAYDGKNRLYFTKEATQRIYYLNLTDFTISNYGIYPYLPGTAIIGNRMEVFTTEDGLKYLWLNRHSFLDCFRTLLFV